MKMLNLLGKTIFLMFHIWIHALLLCFQIVMDTIGSMLLPKMGSCISDNALTALKTLLDNGVPAETSYHKGLQASLIFINKDIPIRPGSGPLLFSDPTNCSL